MAQRFKTITGVNMRPYVDIFPDGGVMLNVLAIEELVEPNDDESIKDAAERKYGNGFVELITQLL